MYSAAIELGPFIAPVNGGYTLLQHILDLEPQGWALEFGVEKGLSLGMIAKHMPAVGFDSFKGLPEDWRRGYPKGSLAHKPPIVPNSRLVIGLFADTLPLFDFATVNPIGLVHIDSDLYSSAATVLEYVGPHMNSGCYIVFDEFHGYPECDQHEQRAWREFIERTGMPYKVIGHSDMQYAVQVI